VHLQIIDDHGGFTAILSSTRKCVNPRVYVLARAFRSSDARSSNRL
jgi:hypothetical protein